MVENIAYYDLDGLKLGLAEEGGALTRLFFVQDAEISPGTETPLLCRAAGQLREYLAGARREFDLPLKPRGTDFQTEVWRALLTIPYGQTRTYGQIAAQIGRPRACRAVGLANNRNPISIIIPCHRVIGADGRLTGYGGGLAVKERLLCLEQAL